MFFRRCTLKSGISFFSHQLPMQPMQNPLFEAADVALRNAENVRHFLLRHFGMTVQTEMAQKAVADILGISQSSISRLEKRILHRLHGELVREEGYA